MINNIKFCPKVAKQNNNNNVTHANVAIVYEGSHNIITFFSSVFAYYTSSAVIYMFSMNGGSDAKKLANLLQSPGPGFELAFSCIKNLPENHLKILCVI